MPGLVPFIVGLVVPDLDRARAELTAALGFGWSPVVEADAAGWPLKVTYALTTEPYLQLIESREGSPWDASDGPRLDHVDVWANEFEADSRRLEAAGFALEVESTEVGRVWRTSRARASRLRVEMHYPSERAAAGRRATFGLPRPGGDGVGPTYVGVGMLIPDLEQAIEELRLGLGLTFSDPLDVFVDETQTRMVRSLASPELRLIEWRPGLSQGAGRTGLDHLVYRSPDLGDEGAHPIAAGMKAEATWRVADATWRSYRGAWSGTGILLEPAAKARSRAQQ